jgi:penicillin-binding protein 2
MSPQPDWIENSEDVKEYQDRYPLLYGFIVATFVILLCRLWYLQIIKGSELKRFSEQNQIKEEKNPAPRGMLLDRNGEILVDSLPTFNVTLTPQYILNLDRTATEVANALGLVKADLIDKVRSSRKQNGVFKPVRIKENISRDDVARIERMKTDIPGLKVEMAIKRNYLLGENGAQLFGYTGEISKEELPILNSAKTQESRFKAGDVIGKAGLEKRWDSEVRGVDGARFVEVDARGREVAAGKDLVIGGFPAGSDYIPGRKMTLTIDRDLQQAAYEAFKKDKQIGSIVALDPRSGDILALVNAPSFDPNHFSTGIPPEIWAQLVNDPYKPLRNKVIQDYFPPGSTFKAVVAIAALQEKIITPQSTFFCPGFLKFGKRPYHCHLKNGHGSVNVYQALERSCDVFFYHLGIVLGIDRIAKYARKLGIGSRTGILLDNERAGLMPDSEWKQKTIGEEWQPGENLSNAIGQGFISVTPLQLASAYAGIATEGIIYKPYLVKKIEDIDSQKKIEFTPQIIHDARVADGPNDVTISQETFDIVKKGLHLVFNGDHGTGHHFNIPGLEMAGKTGTVQLYQMSADKIYSRCENKPLKQRNNGWLVAFAPSDKPQIVVAIHAEHACHPSAAGPTLQNIMTTYFKKYAPEYLKVPEVKKAQIQAPAPTPPRQPEDD